MQRPETGDILFTRGSSLFNRLTCRVTGPAAHQATFYDSGYVVEASAQSGRIEKVECNQVFMDLAQRNAEWIIFRWVNPPVFGSLKTKIQCELLEATEFERYSYIELPLQMLDAAINKWILRRGIKGWDVAAFRKLGDTWNEGVICSKTSNRALINCGLIPTASGLEYGSPSDTYRYLKSRVGKDIVILEKSSGWFDFNGA